MPEGTRERQIQAHDGTIMRQILRKMRVRLFLHAKPRHTFSVHQHVIMLVLRQYRPGSYGPFVEWPGSSDAVCGDLELPHVPHHTTLHKAAQRLGAATLHLAVGRFSRMFCGGAVSAGIDATGFEAHHAAPHCTWRTGLRRQYAKVSACPGMQTQLVMAVAVGTRPHGRHPARAGAAQKDEEGGTCTHHRDGQEVRCRMSARGSQGYRCQEPGFRTRGRHRRKMGRESGSGDAQKEYSQRSKTETAFSVIKADVRLAGQ